MIRRLLIVFVLLALASSAQAACTSNDAFEADICADSPTVFLPLADTTGTTATDNSGNSNNGTYSGGFTLAQTGPFINGHKAVSLGTTSGIVTLAGITNSHTSVTHEFSIYWAPGTTFAAANANFFNIGSGAHSYIVGMSNTGGFSVGPGNIVWGVVQNVGFASWVGAGGPTLTRGVWHHVVVEWTSTSHLVLYVDGQGPYDSGTIDATTGSGTATLSGATTNECRCLMADYAFYTTALSTARVQAHFADWLSLWKAPSSGGSSYVTTLFADFPNYIYRLNDLSGTSATEIFGNTGTYSVSGVTLAQTGPFGDGATAALFDGVNHNTTKMAGSLEQKSKDATVECWVKLAGASSSGLICGNTPSGTSGGWGICIGNGTNCETAGHEVMVEYYGVRQITFSGHPTLNTAWHYVAVTLNSSSVPTLYIDNGSGLAQNASGSAPTAFGAAFGVANNNGQAGNDLNATIADAAFYDSPLTAARVLAHYNAGLAASRGVKAIFMSPF